jgi:hypothetical protein
VAAAVLDAVDARLAALAAGGAVAAAEVDRAYLARAAMVGRAVTLLDGSEPRSGVLEEASPLRGLTLRRGDGTVVVVRPEHAREVRESGGAG